MTKEQAIEFANCLKNNYKIDIYEVADFCDMVINALEIVKEFEKAKIITGGRLNGRTHAYKCGLEDGKRKALEQQPSEDCVSRKAMLNAITEIDNNVNMDIYTNEVREIINALPPVTPKLPTSDDCVSRADARHLIAESFRKNLLGITFNKMFETLYKGINDLPPVTPTQRWIPVSEELPKDRDWYLGIFREHDTGWINRLPFVCDYVGKETKATTKEFWILHGFTDMDNPCDYYKNLECVAWKPLPKP